MSKTALLDAIRHLDDEAVRKVLDSKPALKAFVSERGMNILQMWCARPTWGDAAVAKRQLRLAKWLVGEGFDPRVTYTTKPGEDGEEDVASLSLAFIAVARAQNNELVRYFLDLGAAPEALFAAVWWGNWEILSDLVEHGAKVNVVVGATPVHMAVSLLESGIDKDPKLGPRRIKTLKEIVRLGADINIKDSRDGTPLHTALEKEYDPERFTLLLTLGANPDIPGKDDRTVRQIAARKRDKRYIAAIEKIEAAIEKMKKAVQ